MVTHKPVPSRAAINALRGIVFTTSCSVILLAEERRRRTKIARTAIDNARKLHTVQPKRRSTALPETRFAELDDDVRATLPTMLGKRKRRARLQSESLNEGRVYGVTETRDILPYSTSDVARFLPSIDPDLVSDALRALDLNSARNLRRVHEVKTSRIAQPTLLSFAKPLPRNPQPAADLIQPLTGFRPLDTQSNRAAKEPRQGLEHVLSKARSLFSDSVSSLDGFTVFHSLLDEIIEGSHPPLRTQEALDLANNILKSDAYQRQNRESGVANDGYWRLFQAAVAFGAPNKESILAEIVRTRLASVNFIHNVVVWLTQSQQLQLLNVALKPIIENGGTEQRPEGCKVLDILRTCKHGSGSYDLVLNLYESLVQAGLFEFAELGYLDKYEIRKYVATEAMIAGDYLIAEEQWRNMLKLDTRQTWTLAYDFCSQAVQHKALHLARTDDQKGAKKRLLRLLCESILRTQDPGALEKIVRRLVTLESWKVDQDWILPVMDWHFSHNKAEAALSWLNFALLNHRGLDDRALSIVITHYRQYCRTATTEADIEELCRQLRGAGKVLPEWTPQEAGDKSNLNDVVLRSGRTSTLPMITKQRMGNIQTANEERTFRSMQRMSRTRNWSGAVALYQHYTTQNGQFSLRCLQEAVEAQMRMNRDGWRGARQMLNEAQGKGHDVTTVAERVLSRRLHDGADPEVLVADAAASGVKISDTVYNAAFKSLSRQGNMPKAMSICVRAAEDLGAGNPVFSDWNFSNLLFALVGLGPRRYGELEALVTEFQSVERTWQGNKTCKEAIKLAMKAVAARAVTDDKLAARHEKTLHRLAEALVHCRHVRAKHAAGRGKPYNAVRQHSKYEEPSHSSKGGPLHDEKNDAKVEPSSWAHTEIRHADDPAQPLSAAVGAG